MLTVGKELSNFIILPQNVWTFNFWYFELMNGFLCYVFIFKMYKKGIKLFILEAIMRFCKRQMVPPCSNQYQENLKVWSLHLRWKKLTEEKWRKVLTTNTTKKLLREFEEKNVWFTSPAGVANTLNDNLGF